MSQLEIDHVIHKPTAKTKTDVEHLSVQNSMHTHSRTFFWENNGFFNLQYFPFAFWFYPEKYSLSFVYLISFKTTRKWFWYISFLFPLSLPAFFLKSIWETFCKKQLGKRIRYTKTPLILCLLVASLTRLEFVIICCWYWMWLESRERLTTDDLLLNLFKGIWYGSCKVDKD